MLTSESHMLKHGQPTKGHALKKKKNSLTLSPLEAINGL